MSKIDRVGRGAAAVTSLVLFALLVNLQVISASADQSEPEMPALKITRLGIQPQDVTAYAADSGQTLGNDSVSRFVQKMTLPFGARPIAYVLQDHLYVVDAQGRVIGRADSLKVRDLPVISGTSVRLDAERRHLVDETSPAALELLRCFETQPVLAPLVSGIEVRDGGLIAYMNFGRILPVLFGVGRLVDQVENLTDFYFQLGADDLMRKARYLDLRVEDRVVVKKNG